MDRTAGGFPLRPNVESVELSMAIHGIDIDHRDRSSSGLSGRASRRHGSSARVPALAAAAWREPISYPFTALRSELSRASADLRSMTRSTSRARRSRRSRRPRFTRRKRPRSRASVISRTGSSSSRRPRAATPLAARTRTSSFVRSPTFACSATAPACAPARRARSALPSTRTPWSWIKARSCSSV